jgi:hypothetical protein
MVNAIECGVVEMDFPSKPNTAIRLMEIDNRLILPDPNSMRFKKQFNIQVGQRVLHIMEEPYRLTRVSLNARNQKSYLKRLVNRIEDVVKEAKHHFVALNVQKDKRYTVSLSPENGQLILKSVEDHHCNGSIEQEEPIKEIMIQLSELPITIQTQMNKLLGNINNENSNSLAGKSNQFMGLGYYDYFGLSVSASYGSSGGAKVVSVKPNTSASKIGLRVSDEIIAIGEVNILNSGSAPVEQTGRLINDVPHFSRIKFTIVRDGVIKVIQGKHEPLIIPSSWFVANGTNSSAKFASTLVNEQEDQVVFQLEYGAMILMLIDYAKKNNVQADRITIEAPKRLRTTYGLSGQVLKDKGLRVSKIEPSTIFSNMNLQVGDIITQIGGKDATLVNAQQLTNYFDKLDDGQRYQLMIERNGEKRVLSDHYTNYYHPAITLNIEMATIDYSGLFYAKQIRKLTKLYSRVLTKKLPLRKQTALYDNKRHNMRSDSKSKEGRRK